MTQIEIFHYKMETWSKTTGRKDKIKMIKTNIKLGHLIYNI